MSPDRNAIAQILSLGNRWHAAGTLTADVLARLDALLQETRGGAIEVSAETGCGKSTLLLSQYAQRHLCFTTEGSGRNDSLATTRASPLLRKECVAFILGPSQVTLQRHEWDCEIDVALIDGAHAYPFPELDYYGFYPRLRPGGLLVIDDVQIPTIRRLYEFVAVDAMFEDLGCVYHTAFLRRTNAKTFSPVRDGWMYQNFNKIHFPYKQQLARHFGENWWAAYPEPSTPADPIPARKPNGALRLLSKGFRAAQRIVRGRDA